MAHNLYKEAILARSRSRTHRYRNEEAMLVRRKKNPVCGDDITLYLQVEGGRVEEASFEGHGCAIASAASDLLCEHLSKMDAGEARQMVDRYIAVLREGDTEKRFGEKYEDLRAMEEVRSHPSRIDCAVLAWEIAAELLAENETQENSNGTQSN